MVSLIDLPIQNPDLFPIRTQSTLLIGRGGLIAFGPNPEGRLLDIQSPSKLRFGHVLVEYAIAMVAVLVIVLLGARGARRLLAGAAAPPEGSPPDGEQNRADGEDPGSRTGEAPEDQADPGGEG